MPDIAIIIPTLDADTTFGWESKLRASSVEAELIVRDDDSASAARNAGIREATADKLVFLDDDSVPRGNYFERVTSLLDDHPAVTGRIRDTGARYIRPVSSGDYDQGDAGHVTETVVGCNMAMRRSVVEDIGGFDERLPYGHEETELVDRLCESYDVWYCPDLVVDHPFAESLGGYLEKQYRHGREAIPYYRIRDENLGRRMARFALVPSHYTGPTPAATALQTLGQLVAVAGMARGYAGYLSGDDGDITLEQRSEESV
ncbi:glycosyltransferase family 2 protein [Haloarcula onubensis]|uniref:Glycosyltransferase n=1 Tax=Haloarcula onubensis TaxID=2950539 RepID=A0ABU2FN44_9EURY|nr:glycosyltransferase [Halomicroarcula sp. S3CR25-11]MDS0281601.1 glycosyltransferase [Halomicroarcula sp. S3CR25-11]